MSVYVFGAVWDRVCGADGACHCDGSPGPDASIRDDDESLVSGPQLLRQHQHPMRHHPDFEFDDDAFLSVTSSGSSSSSSDGSSDSGSSSSSSSITGGTGSAIWSSSAGAESGPPMGPMPLQCFRPLGGRDDSLLEDDDEEEDDDTPREVIVPGNQRSSYGASGATPASPRSADPVQEGLVAASAVAVILGAIENGPSLLEEEEAAAYQVYSCDTEAAPEERIAEAAAPSLRGGEPSVRPVKDTETAIGGAETFEAVMATETEFTEAYVDLSGDSQSPTKLVRFHDDMSGVAREEDKESHVKTTLPNVQHATEIEKQLGDEIVAAEEEEILFECEDAGSIHESDLGSLVQPLTELKESAFSGRQSAGDLTESGPVTHAAADRTIKTIVEPLLEHLTTETEGETSANWDTADQSDAKDVDYSDGNGSGRLQTEPAEDEVLDVGFRFVTAAGDKSIMIYRKIAEPMDVDVSNEATSECDEEVALALSGTHSVEEVNTVEAASHGALVAQANEAVRNSDGPCSLDHFDESLTEDLTAAFENGSIKTASERESFDHEDGDKESEYNPSPSPEHQDAEQDKPGRPGPESADGDGPRPSSSRLVYSRRSRFMGGKHSSAQARFKSVQVRSMRTNKHVDAQARDDCESVELPPTEAPADEVRDPSNVEEDAVPVDSGRESDGAVRNEPALSLSSPQDEFMTSASELVGSKHGFWREMEKQCGYKPVIITSHNNGCLLRSKAAQIVAKETRFSMTAPSCPTSPVTAFAAARGSSPTLMTAEAIACAPVGSTPVAAPAAAPAAAIPLAVPVAATVAPSRVSALRSKFEGFAKH